MPACTSTNVGLLPHCLSDVMPAHHTLHVRVLHASSNIETAHKALKPLPFLPLLDLIDASSQVNSCVPQIADRATAPKALKLLEMKPAWLEFKDHFKRMDVLDGDMCFLNAQVGSRDMGLKSNHCRHVRWACMQSCPMAWRSAPWQWSAVSQACARL